MSAATQHTLNVTSIPFHNLFNEKENCVNPRPAQFSPVQAACMVLFSEIKSFTENKEIEYNCCSSFYGSIICERNNLFTENFQTISLPKMHRLGDLKKVRNVLFRSALLNTMAQVHDVPHVSCFGCCYCI